MLTLIEPLNMNGLSDRPDLGCAMLIAACQEKGIKTTLIKGQTCYLRNMFVDDTEELWNLIQDLKNDDLKKIGIAEYKKSIQEKGIRQFQDELKILYQNVVVDKNPRCYFNDQMVEKFNNLHRAFAAIYLYLLSKLNHSKLMIINRYVSRIIKSNPRYIGFSLRDTFEPLTRTVRKRIKESTEIPIILGGSLTPFIDSEELDRIFEKQYLDYLVIGCGEHALPSLIEALDNNKEPKGIPNVYYKKGDRIICNDLKIIDDLDSLPYPDYSQFDLDLYLSQKRILPLQTARGCSWRKCAFCSFHKINLGKYRLFSIEKIIETLRYLNNRYRCYFFSFNQEELSVDQARGISEAILNNNLKNINIYSPARLEDGYNNSALLQLMRKAGFVQLHWGVESGNQRVLNLMNKGTNIKTMSQILRKSFKSGISNICFIFFGFPGENKEEAQQTIEFLKKHAMYIDDISYGIFVFGKYSSIERIPERWGVGVRGDGSYSAKSGMGYEEASAFFSKFIVELKINSIKITSDKLKYLLPGHNHCMLHFLSSSHGLLSNVILLGYLKKRKLNSIFPIILGRIKKKGSRTIFWPIDINETTFVNQYHPEKEKALDSLEKEIFILSDGILSIDDIILIICREYKGGYRKKYIRKKCIDFFLDIFSKDWGLGFAKSWHSL